MLENAGTCIFWLKSGDFTTQTPPPPSHDPNPIQQRAKQIYIYKQFCCFHLIKISQISQFPAKTKPNPVPSSLPRNVETITKSNNACLKQNIAAKNRKIFDFSFLSSQKRANCNNNHRFHSKIEIILTTFAS